MDRSSESANNIHPQPRGFSRSRRTARVAAERRECAPRDGRFLRPKPSSQQRVSRIGGFGADAASAAGALHAYNA